MKQLTRDYSPKYIKKQTANEKMGRRPKWRFHQRIHTDRWPTNMLKDPHLGTSLAVQWLRLHAPNAGDTGSNPVRELDLTCRNKRPHMPQQRSEIPTAATGSASCEYLARPNE